MLKFRYTHKYEVDVATFLDIIFNPDKESRENLISLENVKEREEIDRKEDARYIHSKVRVCAMGFIPHQVRKHVKPDMLTWIEHSTYDKKQHFWVWHIEPHYFAHLSDCRGKLSLITDERGLCERITEGHLNVHVPILGEIAEKIIIEHLKRNMEQEYTMFLKAIERRNP